MSIILNNNSCKSLVKYIKVANVTYLIANKSDRISNILIEHYDGKPSKEYINWLLENGSVYHRDPKETFKTPTPPLPRRIQIDKYILKGSLLKYFFCPRIDSFQHIDLNNIKNKYIIHENQYFIVVDKPHGINLGPIVDSLHNNFTFIIKNYHLNNNQDITLYNPHRLDSATRGLCIIVKDLNFVRKFNLLLINNKITKIYKAFVPKLNNEEIKIKPGIYKHWMKSSKFAPKEIFDEQDDKNSLQECLLKVLSVEEKQVFIPYDMNDVSIDLIKQSMDYNDNIGIGNFRKRTKPISFYVIEIQLITGRTHQIRTQLSKLGYPILSDIMYNGKSLNNLLNNDDNDHYGDDSNLHYPKMIGLVACQLSFKCPLTGEDFTFKLGDNKNNNKF